MSDEPAFTAEDLPTLRKVRDLHRQFRDEGPPADFTPVQARDYRRQTSYTAEWCARIVEALEAKL